MLGIKEFSSNRLLILKDLNMSSQVILKSAALAVLYFLLGQWAFQNTVSFGTVTSAIFFSEGVALAFVLLFGPRVCIGIFVGQLALALTTELSIYSAISISISNTLISLVGYWLLTQLKFDKAMSTLVDYLMLLGVVMLVIQPLGALSGGYSVLIFEGLNQKDFLSLVTYWWSGNVMGQLLLTPLLLILADRFKDKNIQQPLNIPFLLLVLSLCTFYLLFFVLNVIQGINLIHLFALIFPVIAVFALLYQFIGTSIACIAMAVITQDLIVKGNGPFPVGNTADQLLELNIFMLCVIISSSFIGVVLKERDDLLKQAIRLAITDDLTGLYNRCHFFELAQREVNRSQRYHGSLAVITIDIDDFKKINDIYGHIVGDMVLQEVGNTFSSRLRQEDIIGRLGGEEFAVLCPGPSDGKQIAEKLRMSVASKRFVVGDQQISVTISAGVDYMMENDHGSFKDILHRSDIKLYEAKQSGRNKVVA